MKHIDNAYDEFGTLIFNSDDWGFAATLHHWNEKFEDYSRECGRLYEMDQDAEDVEYKKKKKEVDTLNEELEECIRNLTVMVGRRYPTWNKLFLTTPKDNPSYKHYEWELQNILEMTNDLNLHEGDSKEMYEWYDFFMNFFYDACYKLYENRSKKDYFKMLLDGTETSIENKRIPILKSINKIRKLQGWYNSR